MHLPPLRPTVLPALLGALLLAGCAAPRLAAQETGLATLTGPDRADPAPLAERFETWHRCAGSERSADAVWAAAREATEEEGVEREEWRETPNKLVLFVGYTWERGSGVEHGDDEEAQEEGGGGATLGLDVSHHVSEHFAVAAFAEYVAGALDTIVVGGGLEWKPTESLWFFAGPGLEKPRSEGWVPLLRLGGGYVIPLGNGFEVGPAVYMDVRLNTPPAWVVGLGIGKGF